MVSSTLFSRTGSENKSQFLYKLKVYIVPYTRVILRRHLKIFKSDKHM